MAASRKRLSNNPAVAALAASLARHVAPHSRLTLALSGGLDSVALLHLLLAHRDTHPFQLDAVHVHHGLSAHADHWADFCVEICAAQGVELHVHRVQVARDDAAGIEAAARRARQQIFAALKSDFLLTAHHQDDQAETLLIQLLRGAGPKGLAAMPAIQHSLNGTPPHLRPLLGVTRHDLQAYAEAHALRWVEDDSNTDLRYRRNALRMEGLPWFNTHFPGATTTLARAASLQAEASALLDELARHDAATAIQDAQLDCAALATLSDARARNLLRYFIEQQSPLLAPPNGHALPSARRLNEILHQLRDARHDAQVCLSLGYADLVRFRGRARLVAPSPADATLLHWQGEAQLYLPAAQATVAFDATTGSGLKRTLLDAGRVTLGVRQGGERLRLHPGGPHRSLKNLLQEHGIPPWQRTRLPLLWLNDRLVWAAGIGLDVDTLAGAGEAGVMPRLV
ncbi:MAG: tRNA lysidine(34) synthetase TilS [Thiobacillus sp.]